MKTSSKMVDLGNFAPAFNLPETGGKLVSIADFKDAPALLVIFMCNHCPFVKHVIGDLVELIKKYQEKGVAVVGINSNDVENYPDDSPEKMKVVADDLGFTFDYLYDESQDVARAYQATCTPDFFLYDSQRKLVYRGQLDDSRPGNDIPVTGEDLTAAIDALLAGHEPLETQKPSIGCNIKWK